MSRALLCAFLMGASGAWASTPAADEADVSEWRGRYCTPLGCRGGAESALGNAVGFAVAAGSVALLARRRRA
jgi:hypothetical protein